MTRTVLPLSVAEFDAARAELVREGRTQFDDGDVVLKGFAMRPAPSSNGKSAPITPTVPPATADAPPAGWEIIRDYLRARHKPSHRDGDAIYSTADHREVRRQEACAGLPHDLIGPLKLAKNAPQFRGGGVDEERLPGFFKKWAGTGWAALLAGLPDEDAADLGVLEDAREEFRKLMRAALLTEFTLAWTVKDIRGAPDTKVERRSLVGWALSFARCGPWKSIRSKAAWCKLLDLGDAQVVLKVAIRHDVLSQLGADRRLVGMNPNTFARRAQRYGVGKPGGQGDRPHGRWALVINDEFLADLTASIPDDDAPEICTVPQGATHTEGGVQIPDAPIPSQPSVAVDDV